MKVWMRKKERIKYYENTLCNPPSPFIVKTLEKGKFRKALDLGCGAGVDAKEMAKHGIKVTAVDINPEVKKYIGKTKNVTLIISSLEDLSFSEYDLIFAKSVLPFLTKKHFGDVIKKIKLSLNSRGVFAGRFFGPNDSFNKGRNSMTFVKKDELLELFKEYKILEISEIEKDTEINKSNTKHRHLIDILVMKK